MKLGGGSSIDQGEEEEMDIDDDTMEIVEGVLDKLFDSLQDKVTIR